MKENEIVIGTPILYHPVIMDDGEKMGTVETIIESTVWKSGRGMPLCNVKGVRGGVYIEHLEKL